MERAFQEFAPHPALRPFVDRFWARSTAGHRGTAPVRILPDGCIDLVVSVTHGSKAVAIGTMTRAVVFDPRGPMQMVAVRFRPGGAIPFLDVAADELTDRIIESAELGIRWLAQAQFVECTDLAEAVRALERALLERLQAIVPPDPVVAHAVSALFGSAPPSVATLAREIGWSRQHLRRAFRHHVGVSPKQFARVARIQRAVDHLQRGQGIDLADTAVRLGYFDQAHMNRDFRELAGITPRAAAAASAGSIFPIRSLFGGP